MAKYETYEEILELGLFKEQQAHNFYTAMAQRAADHEIKKVFKDLAAEELEHTCDKKGLQGPGRRGTRAQGQA